MGYRPCITSYRLAGSIKIRPTVTGGQLTRVVNVTGFTTFLKRMKDILWPQELAAATPDTLSAVESRPSLRTVA